MQVILILINNSKDAIKSRKIKNGEISISLNEDEKNIKSKSMSPEESFEYKETKEKIEKFINRLDDIDREIIILKYSQNLTFQDISNILKINESSVKRRFYKCREKYKELDNIEEMRCY